MSSPNIQNPKKETTLIAFDKFKKIRYFGISKIEINTADKFLILQTNTAEKGIQELNSTFNRIFIQKENALCVIDGTSNKDFMIIFSQKETCSKIFNAINRAKFLNNAVPKNDPAMNDYVFKYNFYIPILKEIQSKVVGYVELKRIVHDLVNTFEGDERQKYMNMVFEMFMLSTNDSPNNIDSNEIDRNSAIVVDKTKDVMRNDDTLNDSLQLNDQSLNETTTTNGYGFRKRSHANISHDIDLSEFDDSLSTTKNPRLSVDKRSCESVITADYEIVECFRKGSVRKRLLIFTSIDKSYCYEFYYNENVVNHICIGCKKQCVATCIRRFSVENGKITFKIGGKKEHICEPVKYLPENYTINESTKKQKKPVATNSVIMKIVNLPNFKLFEENFDGKISPRLIIFDEKDRNLCYEYSMYDKSGKNYRCLACVGKFNLSVSAKVFTNDEGNLAVKLGSNEHKCKPQEIRILQKSNFKTEMIIEKNGKEVKMLTITDPIYYNKVFTYYFHTYRQCYYCKNCSKTKTYIKANLRVENGEEYIELSADKHVCC